MLSGIPASRLWRSRRLSQAGNGRSATGDVPAREQHSALDVQAQDAEELAELSNLNGALECLTSIFQDVQIEVLREMLSTFSEESRLQVVTECLLRHKDKWVKGRWRVPDRYPPSTEGRDVSNKVSAQLLPRKEQFRSSRYKIAVKEVLYREFKTINHSAIKAILAEHNYSYVDARLALIELMTKSWRVSVTNMILRRKVPLPEQCPLIRWHDNPCGYKEPCLIPTTSHELNEELEYGLIAQLKSSAQTQQSQKDAEYAHELNEEEAESADAMFECQCCFIPNVFERVIACDSHGHFICYRCIASSMKEALYGQGWNSNIDRARASLRCIALQGSRANRCDGCFSRNATRQALLAEPQGREQWDRFESQLAEEVITQITEPISRCPFCHYGEIRAIKSLPLCYVPWAYLRRILPLISLILPVIFLTPINAVIVATLAYYLSDLLLQWLNRFYILTLEPASSSPYPNFGTKFLCRNVACLRSSCLQCYAPWTDIHICHQSSREALRTFVESAVTDAIKRTCPKCNLSFVKSSGCNKLVCVCGYSMCYVCRQDVGKESYAHFCPHFRTNPGQPCEECDRCDLYRTEDEDTVIAEARKRAIATWKEQRSGSEGGEVVANEIMSESQTSNDHKSKRWTMRFL